MAIDGGVVNVALDGGVANIYVGKQASTCVLLWIVR